MGEGAAGGLFLLLSLPLVPGVVLLVIGTVLRRRRRDAATVLLIVGAVLAVVGLLPLLLSIALDLVVIGVAGAIP